MPGQYSHRIIKFRALPIKFEDWEDASSIAKSIAKAKLSFDDLIVDDGQVTLPFRCAEPLVLQLDDSDQGLGKCSTCSGRPARRSGAMR
jgi:hypothetical protein